jgi:hypothetical protein
MDIEQEHGAAGTASPARPVETAMGRAGLSRRNFTRAGIGASGVLLTLASQPGMASEICTTMSGSMSGGAQSTAVKAVACAGRMPDYYKSGILKNVAAVTNPATSMVDTGIQSAVGWPSQVSPATAFGSVFPCAGLNAGTFGKSTLGSVLNHESFDTTNLGMYMVTTYLNIVSGRIGFLTVSALQNMWQDCQNYGYYSPTAGVKWDASRIVTYLTGTMA